ncbi:MAG: acyltransferase family protein, partial [Ruminococcus sp.]|nr:acyltransferase family protein [Ruminococcus sp.]
MKKNTVLEDSARSRHYGIDTLRILSMFMIVVFHLLGDGGIVNSAEFNSLNYQCAFFMQMLVICAVDCFALISGYVGVTSKYRYTNLAVLWLRVEFYSIGISFIYLLLRPDLINIKGFVLTAFPVFSCKYWYFSSYFLLFLFMPFFNRAINNISKQRLKISIMVLVVFSSIIYPIINNIVFKTDVWALRDGFSPVWLAVLY